MSVFWTVDDTLTVDVADPGYGYLTIDRDGRTTVVAGPDIGQLLTELAIAATRGGGHLTGVGALTATQTMALLRVLPAAAIYAAAGTERAERVLDEPDPGHARAPMCVRERVGDPWANGEEHTNRWCDDFGHMPFGEDPVHGAWDDAQCRHLEHQEALGRLTHLAAHRR